MGTLSFTVNDHLLFDDDLFPLDSKYDTKTGRVMQKKTVRKNWHAVGMQECSDGVIRFNQEFVDRERALMKHADARRNEKKRPREETPAAAAPMLPSVASVLEGIARAGAASDQSAHDAAVFLADKRLKAAKDTHEAANEELQRARDMHKAATEELIAASEARARLGY